ncbi:MAG: transporter substrate-binding domain-containing protein [Desulfuromonadaceae bacterium]|nr:transporter substrate-binding domain-containing protein [Desulfuromonadaceae bacterium]MDD5104075.1 transporter substrate-binding domain-containing protein [Desulfuromonadaceae bacterium]
MALITVLLFNGYSCAEEIAQECNTIIYSANPQYPPYHWASEKGIFEGASVELLKKLVPAGVTLKPVIYPWKRSLYLAELGEIDLLLSLRITPERSRYLSFTSHRSFANPIVIFVRKDRQFPYRTWSDLKGHSGVISLGDKFGGGFDEYWQKELTIQEIGTMKENFQRLENGQIDYFVTGQFTGTAFLSSSRSNGSLTTLAPPISDTGIHFGFSKKSPCALLLKDFDRKLAELERKKIPEKLIEKYLK